MLSAIQFKISSCCINIDIMYCDTTVSNKTCAFDSDFQRFRAPQRTAVVTIHLNQYTGMSRCTCRQYILIWLNKPVVWQKKGKTTRFWAWFNALLGLWMLGGRLPVASAFMLHYGLKEKNEDSWQARRQRHSRARSRRRPYLLKTTSILATWIEHTHWHMTAADVTAALRYADPAHRSYIQRHCVMANQRKLPGGIILFDYPGNFLVVSRYAGKHRWMALF